MPSRPSAWLWNIAAVLLFVAFVAILIRLGQSDEGAGLRGRYFGNTQCEGEPLFERVDPVLNFGPPRHPEFDLPELCVEWSGTLFVPVEGHYSFFTMALDAATVWFDDEQIIDSPMGVSRAQSRMLALEEGPHALRILYRYEEPEGDFALLWDRPHRRWYAEYIPEWLLSPDPTESARQAEPPNDRERLVVFWLAFGALLLFLVRDFLRRWWCELRVRPEKRWLLFASAGVFATSLAVSSFGTTRPGQAWDESAYLSAGFNLMRAFLDADFRVDTWWWNSEHPGLIKWLYGTAEFFTDDVERMRWIAVVCGALTCALVVVVGHDLFGRVSIGVAAGLLFALHPHSVAYHSTVGLEAPSALFFTASLWLGLRALREDAPLATWLAFGAAVGLATATKLTNAKAGIAIVLLFLWSERRRIVGEARLVLPLRVLAAPAVAFAVFYAATPRMWSNSATAIARLFGKWGDLTLRQPFLGEMREAGSAYLATYLGAVTPVAILIGAAGFALAAVLQRTRTHAALLLWIALPLSAAGYPLLVDGARYAFTALPALCLASAAGYAWFVDATLSSKFRAGAYAAAMLLVLLSTGQQLRSIGFHYGYDYYNEWVGGAGKAQDETLFLTAWWGEGLSEACEFLNATAEPNATVSLDVMPEILIELRRDLQVIDEGGDYLIHNGIGFSDPHDEDDYERIHVVEAQGAQLASVYRAKPSLR